MARPATRTRLITQGCASFAFFFITILLFSPFFPPPPFFRFVVIRPIRFCSSVASLIPPGSRWEIRWLSDPHSFRSQTLAILTDSSPSPIFIWVLLYLYWLVSRALSMTWWPQDEQVTNDDDRNNDGVERLEATGGWREPFNHSME